MEDVPCFLSVLSSELNFDSKLAKHRKGRGFTETIRFVANENRTCDYGKNRICR